MANFQFIHMLTETWGDVYLFHPSLRQYAARRDWEDKFLRVLPLIECAHDTSTLHAILTTYLSPPLADVRNLRRVHEGWNEEGYPYVYRQFVENIETNQHFPFEGMPINISPSDSPRLSREDCVFGLCKLWIILRHFAPHFPPIESDREAILSDWVSRIETALNIHEYARILEDISATLQDRHASVRVDHTAPLTDEEQDEPQAKQRMFRSSCLAQTRYIRALTDNLVYVTPFAMPDVDALKETFALIQDTHGLILELRGYPHTHFQHELTRCLCRMPVSSPRYDIPVVCEADMTTRAWKTIRYTIEPDGRNVYAKPVIALIDETTQSSAEDFCMYLKSANRVTFVGRPTAGCVGNAAYVNVPGGIRFTFTGMRVTWPDGSPIWNIGILPDVSVEPTLTASETGRDRILEQGLATLQQIVRYEHRAA